MITPGQFEIPGQTPITDPLQLQFMTQGQMGYMPQAQFLTPYQYGNFRTMPTPDVMGYASQETGIIQNYLIANRGSDPFGILPAYTFNTYNPAINARQQQVVAQRRMEDARAAWAPLAADLGINIGMGVFGGIPGMVASMLMPDWLSPSEMVAQRRKSTREIQNLSTSKIFTGADRDEAYGLGFGYKQARGLDQFIRQSAADDSLMKEGDWRDMLQLGMKYGQFDYANSAEQYKRILKNMRGNMTTMMEVIGSTDFEEIMKNMKRMQDMGAQQEHYMNIARKEQQYARVTGLSHGEMVDTYGQSGALTFQQAGLNAMQGSMTAMSSAALATYLQRTGAIDPTLMAHFGGVSGMSQQITQASAKAHRTIQDTLLAGMMNDDFTGLAEGLDLADIVNDPQGMDKLLAGAGRVNTIGKQRRFNVNRHKAYADLQEKYGPEVVEALMARMAGQRLTGSDGEDALFYGYQALGYSSEEAEARLAMIKSGGIWEMANQAKQEQRRKQREEREQRNSPLAKLGRWFESFKEHLGQGVYSVLERSGLPGTHSSAEAAANAERDIKPDIGGTGNRQSTYDSDVLDGGTGGLDLSKMDKSTASAYSYILAHPEDIGAASSWYETGKVGDKSAGMDTAVRDNVGYAYGKYQTNTNRKSHQEWMRDLFKDENPLGQQIVKGIFAAGGVTGVTSENVYEKALQVDWGDKNVMAAYQAAAQENGDFMEESQRKYIMKNYQTALDSIRSRGENGAELARMIDESPGMQSLLYETAVQHGASGASNLFIKAYRPGMDKRNFTENLLLNVRHRNFSDAALGQKILKNRYIPANKMYQAKYNLEDGIRDDTSGVYGGDAGIAAAASFGIAQNAAKGVEMKVRYGLGEKGGTHQVVTETHYDKRKHDPRKILKGEYAVDCSGWVGESLYNMATGMNASAGYDVFDADTMKMFKDAMTGEISSEDIIDYIEDNDRIWQGDQVTEDLLRAQGTMVIGIDTGTTDFDAGRRHGIDHIVTTYVDPATGELMVSESSGSKGVHVEKWSDWIAKHKGKDLQGIYAGSITRLAKTKDGKRNLGTGGYIPGTVQSTTGGTNRATAEADAKEAARLASDMSHEQLHQIASTGFFFNPTVSTVDTAFTVQRDFEHASNDEEAYKRQEAINVKYVQDQINEERRKKGQGEVTVTKEMIEDVVKNNRQGKWTDSYEQFYGNGIENEAYLNQFRKEDGTIDYARLEEENGMFRMNVELADKIGISTDEKYEWALKRSQDRMMQSTYRQMYFANKGYGDEDKYESLANTAWKQYKEGLTKYNEVAQSEHDAALKRTQQLLGVGDTGFFGKAQFRDEYESFVSDTTRTKDASGKESLYTRGQFVEQLPAVAGLLGELKNIEEALKRDKDFPEAVKELNKQKAGIVTAIQKILKAYNLTEAEVEDFLKKHVNTNDRIDDLNKLLAEKNLGMNMSGSQVVQMRKWAEQGQKDTKTAYLSDFERETIEDSYGHVRKNETNEAFKKRREEHNRIANDKSLEERSRVYDVKQLHTMGKFRDAFNLFANYGAHATEEEIKNYSDKEKMSDSRAEAIAQSLHEAGLVQSAATLREFRKQGKAVTVGMLDTIYNEAESRGLKDGGRPVLNSPDLRESNVQATVMRGIPQDGTVTPMGQLSQGANNALERLPNVLTDLTNAINSLVGKIQTDNRNKVNVG